MVSFQKNHGNSSRDWQIFLWNDEHFLQRLADSVQMAFYEGHGTCSLKEVETENVKEFSNKFELDGITFNEPMFIF